MRRKVFHQALVVPSDSLDALWSAYEQFELSSPAKALGRRALDEMRPRCNAARAAFRARRAALEGLDPDALAVPPGAGLDTDPCCKSTLHIWTQTAAARALFRSGYRPLLQEHSSDLFFGRGFGHRPLWPGYNANRLIRVASVAAG